MIAVADTSILLHMFDPNCGAPLDSNGEPIADCAARVTELINRLSKAGGRLIVPTPVLAEILVYAGAAGPLWLGELEGKRAIKLVPFDQLAAIECAEMAAERARRAGTSPRAKAKFDEQIVAIARVAQATEIYSDDSDIRRLAGPGMQVWGMADLPLPAQSAQADLPFEPEG